MYTFQPDAAPGGPRGFRRAALSEEDAACETACQREAHRAEHTGRRQSFPGNEEARRQQQNDQRQSQTKPDAELPAAA